jgi:hypothetical protein
MRAAERAGRRARELADVRRDLCQAKPATASPQPGWLMPPDWHCLPTDRGYPSVEEEPPQALNTDERAARLEERRVGRGQLAEHSQTKVESGRSTACGFRELFAEYVRQPRNTDNIDFPQIAEPQDMLLGSPGSFGGTLRQSIGLMCSACKSRRTHQRQREIDFAGPYHSNGVSEGCLAANRYHPPDWKIHQSSPARTRCSCAGVADLTGLARGSAAVHRQSVGLTRRCTDTPHAGGKSTLTLQGGILTIDRRLPRRGMADILPVGTVRTRLLPRVALGQKCSDRMTIGVGGFYGRETWGSGRHQHWPARWT